MSADEAFGVLRDASVEANIKLRVIAARVVEAQNDTPARRTTLA